VRKLALELKTYFVGLAVAATTAGTGLNSDPVEFAERIDHRYRAGVNGSANMEGRDAH